MAEAAQSYDITTDEVRNIKVDMSDFLDEAETLFGPPLVQSLKGETITDAQVNSVTVIINGKAVPVGKAVLFKLSAKSTGCAKAEVLCATTGGQTIEGVIAFDVVPTLVPS